MPTKRRKLSRGRIEGVDPAILDYLEHGDFQRARREIARDTDPFVFFLPGELLEIADRAGVDSPFVQKLRARRRPGPGATTAPKETT